MVRPCNGILPSSENGQKTTTLESVDDSHRKTFERSHTQKHMLYDFLKEVQKQAELVQGHRSQSRGDSGGRLTGRGERVTSRHGDVLYLGPGSGYPDGAPVEWRTVNICALFFRLQFKKLGENLVGALQGGR